MAAARPKLAVFPSGAECAWGTVESAPPAPSSFLDLRSPTGGPSAPGQSSATVKGKAPAAPQPNVKKMRRRVALLSGVHLNLPSSPVVGPSPPGSSREMAWTFTAEWDSTQDEIVFSEVEGGSSASSSSSSSSLRFISSPIPFDVCEDEVFDLEVFSPPPASTSAPHFSDMLVSSSSSSPSSSSVSSPISPAVSDIFDFYNHSPATLSFSHHERNGSVSTAPSSPVGSISPTEQSLPSYSDNRCDPPVISVTFFDEREDPARGDLAISAPEARAVPAVPALDTYPRKFPSRPETRPLPTPVPSPPSRPVRVAIRPLPPVPVRVNSMVETASGAGAPRRPGRDDRSAAVFLQSLHAPRAPPSAYSPPSPGPTHVRAASLGHGTTGRSASKRTGFGKHFRSISAALTGTLHHRSQC
ncbi:hypothetical protein C8Q78DRAFT_1082616 [Trametes maxima]|nr:hypothetical protein C8Q78DRAFT_1082616 [Trametes maxima]